MRSRLRGLNSLQELYAAFWDFVVIKPSPEAPGPAVREQVLELIVERMDAKQEVSVTRTWLGRQNQTDLEDAVNWLASQGVIIAKKGRWVLLHQTFFDYCYAKNFVENEKSLYQSVKAGDQGLFVRSQILQVLNYSRGADPLNYVKDLAQILSDAGIRFHIRDHVMRWFGSVPAPTADEWNTARQVMWESGDASRLRWYIQGNVGWFNFLRTDVVKILNTEKNEEIDGWVFPLLGSVFEKEQLAVVEIVRPFIDRGPEWIKRIDGLFWNVKEWSPVAIELYEDVLSRSDENQRREFYRIKPIAESQPAAAAKLIRKALEKEFDAAKRRDPSPISWSFRSDLENLNGSGIGEVLEVVAKKEPNSFLDELVPWLEGILLDSRFVENFEYYLNDPLSSGLDYGTYVVQTQLLESLQLALTELGQKCPERFHEVLQKFGAIPFETPQRILARVFTALGELFHHEAKEFLVADRRRLVLGYSEVFDSRQLVKSITPFLTDTDANELEGAIISLSNGKVRSRDDIRFRFRNQLYLLDSFAPDRLTSSGSSYLAELWRKLPDTIVSDRPVTSIGGFVGSPIERASIEKMSDRAWLGAFRKYSKGVSHKEFLRGGAEQLSAELSVQVEANPDRFYALALRISADTESRYLAALIAGIAKSGSHHVELFDIIRRFNAIDNNRLTNVTASALRDLGTDVPDDLLEALERQLYGPASRDEEGWRTRGQSTGPYSTLNDSAYISLLNSVRGSVFQAIMRILDLRDAKERKWSHLSRLSRKGSDALKSGVIEHLLYFYNERKEDCVELFVNLIDENQELLETHFALEFIYWATPSHFERLSRFIRVAMDNRHESVQHRAGSLACLAPLYDQIAKDETLSKVAEELASRARTDSKTAVRSAAAQVYVGNLNTVCLRTYCVKNLKSMLGDSEKRVIEQIARVFSLWTDQDISDIKDLITRFVEVGIPVDEEREFGEFLWKTGMNDPEWSISLIAKWVEKNRVAEGYRDGEHFIRFVLGVYTNPIVSAETKKEALNLFDVLNLTYSGSASRVLSEWDRS